MLSHRTRAVRLAELKHVILTKPVTALRLQLDALKTPALEGEVEVTGNDFNGRGVGSIPEQQFPGIGIDVNGAATVAHLCSALWWPPLWRLLHGVGDGVQQRRLF